MIEGPSSCWHWWPCQDLFEKPSKVWNFMKCRPNTYDSLQSVFLFVVLHLIAFYFHYYYYYYFCKILEILYVVVAFCFLLLFCFLLFGFFLFWLFCFLGVWFIFSILIFSFLDIWIWKSFQSKLLLLLSKLLLFLFDKYTWWRTIWLTVIQWKWSLCFF